MACTAEQSDLQPWHHFSKVLLDAAVCRLGWFRVQHLSLCLQRCGSGGKGILGEPQYEGCSGQHCREMQWAVQAASQGDVAGSTGSITRRCLQSPAAPVGCVTPNAPWHRCTRGTGWTSDPQSVLTRASKSWNSSSEIPLGSHFAYAFSLSVFILSRDVLYSQCKLHIHLPPGTEGENNRIRDWVFVLASSTKCKWLP